MVGALTQVLPVSEKIRCIHNKRSMPAFLHLRNGEHFSTNPLLSRPLTLRFPPGKTHCLCRESRSGHSSSHVKDRCSGGCLLIFLGHRSNEEGIAGVRD